MNFEHLKGRTVIVTGAGNGIGESIAKTYGEHGLQVVCADIQKEAGQATVDAINVNGGRATFYQCDMSHPKEIKALVEYTINTYGKIDGLVNNAGIGLGGFPLHSYTEDQYDTISSINLKGVFMASKYAIDAIMKSGSNSGFIINIASIGGLTPQSGQSLYTATKAGVIGMTKSAALEYASKNITVNAICPGYTYTSIFNQAPDSAMDFFKSKCPTGRMGTPEECAYLALFLASDMARYISGAAIPVDGALSAGMQNLIQWS